MNKNLMKRLIALVLTGGVLISSTGVYTALATTEETTVSETTSALVETSENVANETTVVSTTQETTSEPATEKATEAPTEKETSTEEESSSVQKPEPPTSDVTEGDVSSQNPDDNKQISWVGIDGTEEDAGTLNNPYAVSSVEHFLGMNEIINATGTSRKYFQLTADIDFSSYTLDTETLRNQSKTGMNYSLVSVDPSLSNSSDVFFVLKGNNKRILNVTMTSDELNSMSIFGYLNSSSSIENVTFKDITITNENSAGKATGIILKNSGTVKDCVFTGITVKTKAQSRDDKAFQPVSDLTVYPGTSACIVDNSGIFECSTSYDRSEISVQVDNITVETNSSYAGVLVAQNRGKVNKIRADYIQVLGNASYSNNIGGLVGANKTARTSSSTGIYYAEVARFKAKGLTGQNYIGGIVGYNEGRVQHSKVNGNANGRLFNASEKPTANTYSIAVSGGNIAGGIAGYNTGDVRLCTAINIGTYFTDTVDEAVYGGIVGKTTYSIRNCVATGSTEGAGTASSIKRYIGGIVGVGDTSSSFGVENCYALVKIIDSKADLGAIVGFNGETAYKANRIKNVFYSSIISTRPSPVSYGGAGASEGDLVFSKSYMNAYYRDSVAEAQKNEVSVKTSELSFSGWGDVSIAVTGDFEAKDKPSGSYFSNSGSSMTYYLTSTGTNTKTTVYYSVKITLPSNVGSSTTVLTSEKMELGILNTKYDLKGEGTKDSPFELTQVEELNLLSMAPAAHFVLKATSALTANSTYFTASPATFWGSVDFNNVKVNYSVDTPLFRAVYGSRDGSLSNNDSSSHKSSSADSDDSASNLEYGVIKNANIVLESSSMSNFFGNICNATVKNCSVTFGDAVTGTVKASEGNSGLFAKAVYGNSYIYGCYVIPNKIVGYATQYNAVSGFIGTVDAECALIDNCGANINVLVGYVNASNCAVFIGKIKSLSGGYIQNCYASGGVAAYNVNSTTGSFGSNNYIFAGESASSSVSLYNCYYSPSYYYSNGSGIKDGIKSGSFTGSCKTWSFAQINSSNNTWSDVSIKVSTAEDTVHLATLENIDKYDINTSSSTNVEKYFTASSSNETTLSVTGLYWSPSKQRVEVAYSFSGAAHSNATLLVTHNATGLVARLTVYNSSDLEIDADGFYLIKSPIDLYYLSAHQTDKLYDGTYKFTSSTVKIKLVANIDMGDYIIEPIGQSNNYFEGTFVSDVDESGNHYTISNLTFSGQLDCQALFGYAKNAVIDGVHIDNAVIDGTRTCAALLGEAIEKVTIENCKVTNSSISAISGVGAIVGGVGITKAGTGEVTVIKNCTVENTTIVSKEEVGKAANIGGIIGRVGTSTTTTSFTNIENCTVKNSEISAAGYYVGGIVGYAPHNSNTINGCTVSDCDIYTTASNGTAKAALGGIAGAFGGSAIADCGVVDSQITGECAAGIVTKLNNDNEASSITGCTVTNSVITSDNIAGGIVSQIGSFFGDKTVENCKVSADTKVTGLVAGGIVGNVQSFSGKVLKITGCTNLGTITTTGAKGSTFDGAGGIVGRLGSAIDTSNYSITGCLSQGKLTGVSVLGGIIGVYSSLAHSSKVPMISDCYVTSAFVSKNIAVVKGLIAGYVGAAAKNSISKVSNNVVYSSLDTKVSLFGNVSATVKEVGAYDMNLGSDQEKGLTVDISSEVTGQTLLYVKNAVVGYEQNVEDGKVNTTLGTNTLNLKDKCYKGSKEFENYGKKVTYDGSTSTSTLGQLSNTRAPQFEIGNQPSLEGFAAPTENVFTTKVSEQKLVLGGIPKNFTYNGTKISEDATTYNTFDRLRIYTFANKCNASVYTTYTGTVNGETVKYNVGFTVVVKGNHAFDGTGTESDPFIISTPEDLLSIKQHFENPNDKDAHYSDPEYYYADGTYYEVVNDIDMSEELESAGFSFAPIGSEENPFCASIKSTSGEKYTIKNMYINTPVGSSSYAYNNEYGDDYSDALGVFGYTDGAEISDLIFENVNITAVSSAANEYIGSKTGAVVGNAVSTKISNVDVIGDVNIQIAGESTGGAVGGIVGIARNDVILSDVSLVGTDNDSRATVSSLYLTGGIVGSSADSTGGSITNARVENADITNNATSGRGVAGAVAGRYSGVIKGTYSEEIVSKEVAKENGEVEIVTETVKTRNPVVVNNVLVTAIVAGGVVGSGNYNTSLSGGCDLTVEVVDVKNAVIEVPEVVRTNANSVANGFAGGVLGTSYESYNYLIEDCIVESTTTVTTGYCAGGIVGRVNNRGVGTFLSDTSMYIKNCESYAELNQLNAPNSASITISDDNRRATGLGGIIGVVSTTSFVMNISDNSAQLKIYDCTAGGNLSGTFNVGGLIGQFACVQSKLNEASEPFAENCIISAKFTELADSTERFGIILGSVDGNTKNPNNPNNPELKQEVPFPEADSSGVAVEYAVNPFNNIFYSSYTTSDYNLYGISSIKDYQDESVVAVFNSTVYDINKVNFNFVSDGTTTKLPVSIVKDGAAGGPAACYQWFGKEEYVFSDAFEAVLAANNGSGDPFGFTLAGRDFELAENGISSSDENIFKVVENTDTHADKEKQPYKIKVEKFDTANLVFTYKNGMKIAIPVICGVNYEGSGSSSDPIQVSNEDIFYFVVKVLPGYSFIQTADLDFTGKSQYVAKSADELIGNFTGTYDGQGHTITGLTAEVASSDSPLGIFGKISGQQTDDNGNVIANVKDLTFVNCTITGGSTDDGTGVFAGEVTNSAKVENIKIESSSVTSSAGNVGGAIGTVSGASTIENVQVSDTVVTSSKGSAGGVVGTMTDSDSKIISPSVTGSTITSGTGTGDEFAGGQNEDIAGGIVAQAVGTIKGGFTSTDDEGNLLENEVLSDAVSGTKVSAYYAGGAVGAVYNTGNDAELNVEDVKVSSTAVTAKEYNGTNPATSGGGLLGIVRGKTAVKFQNSYVDNKSTVYSQRYGGGVIGTNTTSQFKSIDVINTEAYAKVTVSQASADKTVHAGGIMAYIQATDKFPLDLNCITIDGSVAGGKITAEGKYAYAGGVIGAFNTDFITQEVTTPFFVNGVVSASVYALNGEIQDNASGSVQASDHRTAKFIAVYDEGDETPVFPTSKESFKTVFSGNYYSTYPQDIDFFHSQGNDQSVYESLITDDEFKDINISGNLVIADENQSSWNSVAITKDIGTDTLLYAKLSGDYSTLYYGSKDNSGSSSKVSVVSKDGFTFEAVDGNDCIELVGDISETAQDGTYELTVRPKAYGAQVLVAEYTCGLATTATVISVEIKGEGTEAAPYLIGTPTQLRVVGYLADGNKHFRQIRDIDLSNSYNENGTDTDKIINYNGGKGFAPIGTNSTPFDGVFDGQGYKITGVTVNRNAEDYVGLFGCIRKNGNLVPTVKNVHVELTPADASLNKANGMLGKDYVGGIVGYAEGALIENCSVTVGSVTGNDKVGGIAGYACDSEIKNCFTQSDVSAFGTSKPRAAGIVAEIKQESGTMSVKGCFASGSVYATPVADDIDSSNAAGIVGYIHDKSSGVEIKNCLFTGTTASGYGILGSTGSVNMKNITVSSCIDAGQNVAMAAGNRFDKIKRAVASENVEGNVKFENVYYDNALLKVDTENYPDDKTGFNGLPTSSLINGSIKDGISSSEWSYTGGYYPVPITSEITVNSYNKDDEFVSSATYADAYSAAYARFLSAPVQVSEDEECNDISDTSVYGYGKGLVYPVTLITEVDNNKVTYSSSIFDTSDTVSYPKGYDTKLYGVGENKNVDLLFEDKDNGYTYVYRNIFDSTIDLVSKTESGTVISKNTRVNAGASSGSVFANGEAYYNAQVPVVHATAEINGVKVERDIKVPLSYGTTYCIATQRQLYALGKADYELEENSKFSDFSNPTYNYKLIADIDCGDNTTVFTPIGSDVAAGYTGQFDGSGHTIKNLIIKSDKDYVGMFSKVSKDYNNNINPFVKNLTLENATVEGASYVGTLIGLVQGENVTVENCHAVGSTVRDENGNITETYGTVTGSGSYVGGLIGKVDYPSDTISKSSASVTVSGNKNSVGGLLGESGGTISSCYATGNVLCDSLSENGICGVGGLIGIMSNGTVSESFASGNVEVKKFKDIKMLSSNSDIVYGVGGFVGYVSEKVTSAITECFSGGNVELGEGAKSSLAVTYNNKGIVGIGGFSGVSYAQIENCYSSAAVKASFGSISNNKLYQDATYGVGIGGVCGVALNNVKSVYSSGSVVSSYDELNENVGNCYYGVGGTVGTTMNADNVKCEYCYFDRWTNTDSELKSIGNKADDEFAMSLTTDELAVSSTAPSKGMWDSTVWGFTANAYPYLISLLNENVDNYIKTNAILSVVCVNVDEEDVSAKKGSGITMALTVPSEFKYTDNGEVKTYNLSWSGATLNGNKAAINRTKNVAEYLDVVATVVDYEKYANRTYSRLCADMKGTYSQPYLIGNETDLEHVNMDADELAAAKQKYTGFYDQWATPLDAGNNQVEGTVYYQLMSDIDVKTARNIPSAPEKYKYNVSVYTTDENSNTTVTTEEKEFTYQGFVFNGNAYAIQNVSTTGNFITKLDENSKLTNMIFDNLTFENGSNSALVGTNNGEIYDVYVKSTVGNGEALEKAAGLTHTNNGTIDGCVVDVTVNGASKNVAVMALVNAGTIRNSATAGSIKTTNASEISDIGAFVINNTGNIEKSFSMADIDVLASENADVSGVSGFAVKNSGTINGVYTRSAISFENAPAATQTVSSLVSTMQSGGTLTNAYAAGLLGYYNNSQNSIAFGSVYEGFSKPDSVYIDKSLSGKASYNSFDYAASTSSIISMQYMLSSMKYVKDANEDGIFVAGEESTNTFPQLASILNAENTEIIDENGEPIEIENGVIIRNYDVIKAYSAVSSMALKTSQSQYADGLAPKSASTATYGGINLNSELSIVDGIQWNRMSSNEIVIINPATKKLETTSQEGKETIYASYRNAVELTRGTKINPQLLIDVAVAGEFDNPNFDSGYGTKENPYIIKDADSLQSLKYYGSESTLYFELGSDIDMSEYSFAQIPVFNAHLNEGSSSQYAIENLKSDNGGLFGLVDNATVNNVALAGAKITSSGAYTGALADKVNGGKVTNCVISANVASSSEDTAASTGLLAGIVYGNAVISGIITTGDVTASSGTAGGVIGYAQGVTMSEFVSTANVCDITEAGGIVGVIGEDATLENAVFGGVAKNNCPIVSTVAETSAVTSAYYDKQLNKDVANEAVGQAMTTAQCSNVFASNDKFVTLGNLYYPIPSAVAVSLESAASNSYSATASLAAATMTFYLGSSRGFIGYYTSMQFTDSVDVEGKNYKVTVKEENNGGYFNIENTSDLYVVRVNKYNAQLSPVLVLTLENGAKRTIAPGLVRTANISYTITNPNNYNLDTATYAVLFKSVASKSNLETVNVLNDFTKEIGTAQTVDSLIIADNVDGFYVGDMLPSGYKYEVSAKLNGTELDSSKIVVEENVYGTFVNLKSDSESESTNVELTLRIVKDDEPWGVRSRNGNLK